MLILHVTYTARPGEDTARKFVEELEQDAAVKVRAEDGNICYDYFFSAADSRKILLVEKWRDDAALAAHMQAPHMADIRAIKEKYTESAIVEKYSVL